MIIQHDVVMVDDADKTIIYDVDSIYGLTNVRTIWKSGSSGDNQQQIQIKLQQAITFFGGNYANWESMSAAQKDAAAKQAQRALSNIARYLLGQFDSSGS
jgi:hypothetical protein